VGRIGTGVRVSVSFRQKYPPGSVLRCPPAKNRRFHVQQATFLFPLETPLRLSRNMLHGCKDNSVLAKSLAALYPPICNSFPVIRTASAKNRRFHVPQPTFLFPLETPLLLSRNMLHGWKDNSMLAKPLAALTHLFSTVSQLFEQQMQKNRFPLGTLNVV